jgi:hypothetical protein
MRQQLCSGPLGTERMLKNVRELSPVVRGKVARAYHSVAEGFWALVDKNIMSPLLIWNNKVPRRTIPF